jgi:hypothetical protein
MYRNMYIMSESAKNPPILSYPVCYLLDTAVYNMKEKYIRSKFVCAEGICAQANYSVL